MSLTQAYKHYQIVSKISIANYFLAPLARVVDRLSPYRQLGLRYGDLLQEETPSMQRAIRRLPAGESYDRVWRIKLAQQLELEHHVLPKEKWTKDTDNHLYNFPYILEAEAEDIERANLDTLEVPVAGKYSGPQKEVDTFETWSRFNSNSKA